jgi:hypothetical protein
MGFNGPSVKQSNDEMMNPPRAHWPEWLFSFACCGMIASNARNQRLEGEPFSVMTYYGQTPGVEVLQGIGWVVAVAFILVAALWIMRPKWGYQCQHALTLISGMGFVVAWLELVTALEYSLRFQIVSFRRFAISNFLQKTLMPQVWFSLIKMNVRQWKRLSMN